MYKVCVLLSTYNGEKYLKTQIESVLAQQDVDVTLLVRDDGSKDGTLSILNHYQNENKLKWYTGENLRSGRSFLDLLAKAPDFEYYAFCDQDDYWQPEKLIRGIEKIHSIGQKRPAMYYSRAKLVDENLNAIESSSNIPFEKLDFITSFIINNVAGCTMVFNSFLRERVLSYTPQLIGMHDSWVYKVCLAENGYVYCDKESYILYRQHGGNVLGGVYSPIKAWKRRLKTISSSPCYRSRVANEIYKGFKSSLTKDNERILYLLSHYKASLYNRFLVVFSNKIKTPYLFYTVIFKCAVLMGKF